MYLHCLLARVRSRTISTSSHSDFPAKQILFLGVAAFDRRIKYILKETRAKFFVRFTFQYANSEVIRVLSIQIRPKFKVTHWCSHHRRAQKSSPNEKSQLPIEAVTHQARISSPKKSQLLQLSTFRSEFKLYLWSLLFLTCDVSRRHTEQVTSKKTQKDLIRSSSVHSREGTNQRTNANSQNIGDIRYIPTKDQLESE